MDGRIEVSFYHENRECDMCPVNLCKGAVLNEFLKGKPQFEKILYVGGALAECIVSSNNITKRWGWRLSCVLAAARDGAGAKRLCAGPHVGALVQDVEHPRRPCSAHRARAGHVTGFLTM